VMCVCNVYLASLSRDVNANHCAASQHAFVFGTVREAAAKASRLSARAHREEAEKRKEALRCAVTIRVILPSLCTVVSAVVGVRREKAEVEAAERVAKEQLALEEAEKARYLELCLYYLSRMRNCCSCRLYFADFFCSVAQELALAAALEEGRRNSPNSQSPNERRATEAKRFLEALRKQVVSRVEATGVSLPRLCSCSPHLPVLAPHWEHCANNCLYYRNPKVAL
jgi:hypothetical protein